MKMTGRPICHSIFFVFAMVQSVSADAAVIAFGPSNIVVPDLDEPLAISLGDMDSDGDLDVISLSSGVYPPFVIVWYENDRNVSFSIQHIIAFQDWRFGDVRSADIDGDGDTDMVAVSDIANKIVWFENLDSLGNFAEELVVSYQLGHPNLVKLGDIDGDGDIDLLVSSSTDDKIVWFANQDGSGHFSSMRVITDLVDSTLGISLADLDDDGDLDLLSASANDNKLAWYANINGHGIFGPQRIISDLLSYPKAVLAADLDGDGKRDVACVSAADGKLVWYRNEMPAGSFGEPVEITNTIANPSAFSAADFDADGDVDIVASSRGDNKIYHFENVESIGQSFLRREISSQALRPTLLDTGDIDSDGLVDVLYANPHGVYWSRNVGGAVTFKDEFVNSDVVYGPNSVIAADVDGDSSPDIFYSSRDRGAIYWLHNVAGTGTFLVRKLVSDQAADVHLLRAGDIDLDGDVDLLYSSRAIGGVIAWFDNLDSRGSFGVKKIAATLAGSASDIKLADIDGDGDLDIVYASADLVALVENVDGRGTFGPENILTTEPGPPSSGAAIAVADFDGNSAADVAVFTYYGPFALLTNEAGNFTRRVVDDGNGFIYAVEADSGDIDGDGDPDLVIAPPSSGVLWFENVGNAVDFTLHQNAEIYPYQIHDVKLVDLDSDGDRDILCAEDHDTISWYENDDGAGHLKRHKIFASANGIASVEFADVDGDLDLDAISISANEGRIRWYENMPDSDGDEEPDRTDGCPQDPSKTRPMICGCGVEDRDDDWDGAPDCVDECPSDYRKIVAGACGCGFSDTDTDSDSVADCVDLCPADPRKAAAGICGCGLEDVDSDIDGTADCFDGCPIDKYKIDSGLCGCGVVDDVRDSDSDGHLDCIESCDNDPGKTAPGICGCGVLDNDSDGDGVADCLDECPLDENKRVVGVCGCGTADVNSDGDGSPDCIDGCSSDSQKTEPGTCGCGVQDTDADNDGTMDCADECPDDAEKIEVGICGCGVREDDGDQDSVPDCIDECADDSSKVAAGVCGCGIKEEEVCESGEDDEVKDGGCGCSVDKGAAGIPSTSSRLFLAIVSILLARRKRQPPKKDHPEAAGQP